MMATSPISARNGRWIGAARHSRDRASTAPNWARALLLLAPLTLGLACVDLTPPKELVAYLAGDAAAVSGTGGDPGIGLGGASGAAGAGGGVGAGGITGVGGGSVVGGSGTGGAPGTGGAIHPDAAGGTAGADAGTTRDTPIGSGGTSGSDGSTDTDSPIGPGGITGTGGTVQEDAPNGTGGKVGTGGAGPDVPPGTGGKVGTGGIVGTGGKVGTGGAGTGGAGTGGAPGTGGAGTGGAPGTGGATGYTCASPIVPASGYVTNFTDWNSTTARWGTGTLIGTIAAYASTNPAATMTATVAGTPPGLHLAGSVTSTGYAGGILTFLSCVTTASFTKVLFDVYGSAAGCTIDLQLETFDQRPSNQSPPGGCDPAGTCYTFPHKSAVVDSTTLTTTPKTVTTTLNTMTNWTAAEGAQIVGVRWQFTGSNCTLGATFTNIKFQ